MTGKTGSGCSTVANILKTDSFSDLGLPTPKDHDFNNVDERKYSVVHRYMHEEGKWTPFYVIHASSVIFSYILEAGYNKLEEFITALQQTDGILIPSSENLKNDIKRMYFIFEKYNQFTSSFLATNDGFENTKQSPDLFSNILSSLSSRKTEELKRLQDFLLIDIPKWKEEFESILNNHSIIKSYHDDEQQVKSAAYIYIMQTIGNNIRCSGTPYGVNHTEQHFYEVAKRIDIIIQLICHISNVNCESANTNPHIRICIDAIRNSYEALYFKDKYSYFYLVSVNTDESERKRRLDMFDQGELDTLDQTELAKDDSNIDNLFYHQNMGECLSISDIHIYNPRQTTAGKFVFLTQQLLKYLCLMLHPGLVAPTAIERCMQTAYVAKLNSGCLSRQVGAVITDQDFSIKAIGWNDVPSGQIPCNLRCVQDYVCSCDSETFSDFERQDEDIHDALTSIQKATSKYNLEGLGYFYCFKDVYNTLKRANNQVHTRALHAEENAFLQIAKYGGMGIKGGKLFSTASPCELCSKKAFQLGIKEIYYIDPYPGISKEHILQFGTFFRPTLNLFYGAIGNAYVNLYTPRIPLKDEIELLTGKSTKEILQESNSTDIEVIDQMKLVKFQNQTCSFLFYDREHMLEIDEGTFSVRKSGIVNYFSIASFWSGNEFNGFSLEKCNTTPVNHTDTSKAILLPLPLENLRDKSEKSNIYSCRIPFSRKLEKGDLVDYEIHSFMSDMAHTMYPYYMYAIQRPIEHLVLRVFEPNGLFVKDSTRMRIYSGKTISDEFLLEDDAPQIKHLHNTVSIQGKEIQGIWHQITIDNPNMLDCYCICWEFQSNNDV